MLKPLQELSHALAAHAVSASESLAAVRLSGDRSLSAILWSSDVVVTSNQSLPDAAAYEIVFAAGNSVRAVLRGRDPGTNVAVLKLDEPRRTGRSLAPAMGCQVGEIAVAYGADLTGSVRARLGAVNGLGPEWHSRAGGRLARRIELDIALTRGEEGGAVCNGGGELIGMSTFGRGSEVLAIPTETIEGVLPGLLTEGQVRRGWLGLTLQPVAVPHSLRESAGQRGGMMIMSVVADGPASRAGLIAGDILLTVGGAHAVRMDRVAAQLDDDSIGQLRAVRVVRNGTVSSIDVVIEARPAA